MVGAATLRLVHHHPGRLRLRADGLDEASAAAVHAAVDAARGVLRVAHSIDTGSILIEYTPGQTRSTELVDRVARALGAEAVVDETGASKPVQPAVMIKQTAAVLDALTREVTGGRADLRVLVPAALGAAAAYSAMEHKGSRMPRWDNLLWWSYSIFVQWNAKAGPAASGDPGGPGATPGSS